MVKLVRKVTFWLIWICGDASEREAVRQHSGWVIKRARDAINTGNKTVSIKQSQGLPTLIEVTKERLLAFFEKFMMFMTKR